MDRLRRDVQRYTWIVRDDRRAEAWRRARREVDQWSWEIEVLGLLRRLARLRIRRGRMGKGRFEAAIEEFQKLDASMDIVGEDMIAAMRATSEHLTTTHQRFTKTIEKRRAAIAGMNATIDRMDAALGNGPPTRSSQTGSSAGGGGVSSSSRSSESGGNGAGSSGGAGVSQSFASGGAGGGGSVSGEARVNGAGLPSSGSGGL